MSNPLQTDPINFSGVIYRWNGLVDYANHVSWEPGDELYELVREVWRSGKAEWLEDRAESLAHMIAHLGEDEKSVLAGRIVGFCEEILPCMDIAEGNLAMDSAKLAGFFLWRAVTDDGYHMLTLEVSAKNPKFD